MGYSLEYNGHTAFFLGEDWDTRGYFSQKSFFAALKEMRAPLKRHAAVFDEYLAGLFKAVRNTISLDPFHQGFKAGERLHFKIKIQEPPANGASENNEKDPFAMEQKECAALVDFADEHYKQALRYFKDDLLFTCNANVDLSHLDKLYKKLEFRLGKDTMLWILFSVRERFLITPALESFRQGYTSYCTLLLTDTWRRPSALQSLILD